jgi:hypothetical protein
MTKAATIRQIVADNPDITPQEMAVLVGCTDSYARVYMRQRIGGVSDIDRRYLSKPGTREAQRVRMKMLLAAGDKDYASDKGRAAYQKALKLTRNTAMARLAYNKAYYRACMETASPRGRKLAIKAAAQVRELYAKS